jgi:hypothetical protein
MTGLGDCVRVVRHDEDGPLVHLVTWVEIRCKPSKRVDRVLRMACGMMTNVVQTNNHVTTAPLSCVWCIASTRRFP